MSDVTSALLPARRPVLRQHRRARRRARRLRDPLHLRSLPAAAVSDRVSGRPVAGARHRLGCAARPTRAAGSAGSISTRTAIRTPDDPLHWTGIDQTWNFMCAECHSTELRKNYDPATDSYATTWVEIDVACEACHGPGSAHVDWARRQQSWLPWGKGGDDGLTVHFDERQDVHWTIEPATGNAVRSAPRTSAKELETCGVCHVRSRQDRRGLAPRPAAPRNPRAVPAAARPVRGRRQDAGRGLRLRFIPPEQDVQGGRQLQRLPRPPFAGTARRRQRRLPSVS